MESLCVQVCAWGGWVRGLLVWCGDGGAGHITRHSIPTHTAIVTSQAAQRVLVFAREREHARMRARERVSVHMSATDLAKEEGFKPSHIGDIEMVRWLCVCIVFCVCVHVGVRGLAGCL